MRILAVFTFLLCGCATMPTPATAADTPLAAAAACENLILDYAWHWDHHEHRAFADLFTDDGVLMAAGRSDKGRDAIYAEQSKRSGKLVTRMFFSNVRITPDGADSAQATTYFMVHSEAGEVSPSSTVPTRGFRLIGEMAFTFSQTAAGWKIASVDMTPVFSDENLND